MITRQLTSSVSAGTGGTTIRAKLMAGLATIFGIVALGLLLVVPTVLKQQTLRQLHEQAVSISRLTAYGIAPALLFDDRAEMRNVIAGATLEGHVRYIVVEDTARHVMAAMSSVPSDSADYRASLTAPGEWRDLYRVAVPIVHSGATIGTLFVGLSMESANEALTDARGQLAGLIVAVMLASFVLAAVLGTHLARPVGQIAAAARAIQQGDLSARSGVTTADEVGALATTFDAMVAGLQQAQEEMRSLNHELEQRVEARTKDLEAALETVRQAERVARESEQRFRAMFSSAPMGIAIIDPDGRIRDTNPAFQFMWQSARERLVGCRFAELFESPEDPELPLAVKEALSGKRTVAQGTVRPLVGAGAMLWGHTVVSPVKGADGTVWFSMAIVENVTAQRELADQLRESQRLEAVGRLAGGVAHDFNNLLTTVNGITELMLADASLAPEVRRDVQEVHEAGARAAALTRQMLAFSRRQTLQWRVLDLNRVILDMSTLLRRMVGDSVEISLHLADGVPAVRADVTQLTQVFMNLAMNARDAMPNGGRLVIETTTLELAPEVASQLDVDPGDVVRIDVWDNGEGMDAVTLSRAFEPFFTTKEVGQGSGLGLATAHGIIKQFGGDISVESAPGKGAHFTITLPAVDAPVDAEHHQEASPATGDETILLIEDDKDVRALTSRVLRSRGFEVLSCVSGDEAVRLAESGTQPFHLIVSDVVLPGISGPAAVARIRELLPNMRAIFMSGYPREELLRYGLEQGEMRFLQKPVGADDLVNAVRQLLDTQPA